MNVKQKEKRLERIFKKILISNEYKKINQNDFIIDIDKVDYNNNYIEKLIKHLYDNVFYYYFRNSYEFSLIYHTLRNIIKLKGNISKEKLDELGIRVGVIRNKDYSNYIWVEQNNKIISSIILYPDSCLWEHGHKDMNRIIDYNPNKNNK